jgi:hypothetical protein
VDASVEAEGVRVGAPDGQGVVVVVAPPAAAAAVRGDEPEQDLGCLENPARLVVELLDVYAALLLLILI